MERTLTGRLIKIEQTGRTNITPATGPSEHYTGTMLPTDLAEVRAELIAIARWAKLKPAGKLLSETRQVKHTLAPSAGNDFSPTDRHS
jgi:hypothetical protein